MGNRLYRYELISNKLVNPKLLVDLPATPGTIGMVGKVIVEPDNNVHVTIGDVGIDGHDTKAQNVQNGMDADGTSGILGIIKDGWAILPGVLGNKFPLNLYYSYGIWNSFGIDFDTVTGNLWDTENGIFTGDIINGNIYHFRFAPNRIELLLPAGPLEDRVVNSSDTVDGIIIGRGFGALDLL